MELEHQKMQCESQIKTNIDQQKHKIMAIMFNEILNQMQKREQSQIDKDNQASENQKIVDENQIIQNINANDQNQQQEQSQPKSQNEQGQLEQCSICLENLQRIKCVIQECQHIFCADCIVNNYQISNRCPLCRGNIEKEVYVIDQLQELPIISLSLAELNKVKQYICSLCFERQKSQKCHFFGRCQNFICKDKKCNYKCEKCTASLCLFCSNQCIFQCESQNLCDCDKKLGCLHKCKICQIKQCYSCYLKTPDLMYYVTAEFQQIIFRQNVCRICDQMVCRGCEKNACSNCQSFYCGLCNPINEKILECNKCPDTKLCPSCKFNCQKCQKTFCQKKCRQKCGICNKIDICGHCNPCYLCDRKNI